MESAPGSGTQLKTRFYVGLGVGWPGKRVGASVASWPGGKVGGWGGWVGGGRGGRGQATRARMCLVNEN